MRTFDPQTLARLDAGEVDFRDAVTLVFDSGVVNFFLGGIGQFQWNDAQIGLQTFHGSGALVSIDVPSAGAGADSEAIKLNLLETFLEEDSETPTNIFDDGVRATIDEEEWEGRQAILSIFWFTDAGTIIEREQLAVREMDSMPLAWDEAGNPIRSLVLEEPDITQRDIEGRTANAAFQALIDPTDKSAEHIGAVRTQKITFGRVNDEPL